MGMSKFATAEDYYKAEAEKNREDAERYRWLRAQVVGYEMSSPHAVLVAWPEGVAFTFSDIDGSVEAAMAVGGSVGAA